ncbi:MAG: hypothetical protein O2822_04775 [Chloroflexi bacterium]|nr:hypothetical protein [Chloroflexota bacterium]
MFDRHFRGFGLGLFVAHRSAENLGWQIRVRNVPDGCEFLVVVPIAPRPPLRG